jgi:hypothetical protein
MDASLAKAIVDAVEGSGLEISIYPDYSGRGMYGKTTTGVVVDHESTFNQALVSLAYEMGRDGDDEKMEQLFDVVKKLRRDNLGEDKIIY